MHRCGVCGFTTEAPICPRCATILARGEAVCPTCGKVFSGPIALCDTCGARVGPSEGSADDEESVRLVASVPGISKAQAEALVARGVRNVSDVIRLALPESDVRKGTHHAIAHRILLGDPPSGAASPGAPDRCPACGAAWLDDADGCDACGFRPGLYVDLDLVARKLQEVTQEIVGLSADPAFREMPVAVREEIAEVLTAVDTHDLLREEYEHQINAWRERGFDVTPLERLLDADLAAFREHGTRLIRAQALKKSDGGRYLCPLCEAVLSASAEECGNCGARFS